jgi:hypothetical protein
MRIRKKLGFTLLAGIGASAYAADSGYIASLAGKYPWEGARAGAPGFFEVPSVKASLHRMLPPEVLRTLTEELTTGTPNSIVEGFLLVSACKPHGCPSKNYIAITNPRNSLVTVVLFDTSAGSDDISRTHCFSSLSNLNAYPAAVIEEILAMHIPLMKREDKLYPKNSWIDEVKCVDGSNTSLERTRDR